MTDGVSADTPSQRVQFILGTEDDDEEHIPHDLFTELDELAFRDGDNQEWKETARQDAPAFPEFREMNPVLFEQLPWNPAGLDCLCWICSRSETCLSGLS